MNPTHGIETVFNSIKLEDFLGTIDYRASRNREELEKAYSLVYREYLKRGYAQENAAGLRLSIYNALPESTTFIAIVENEIAVTATLVADSPLGLPMDEIYHQELSQFRKKKVKLCEITMLASSTDLFQDGVSLMLNSRKLFFIFFLFKLIYDYARYVIKVDYICITINPKHKLTYDFLLFKDLGELKAYQNANGAPAIAKYLDLVAAEDECKRANREGLYKMFFVRKTPPDKFFPKYIFSPEDLKYFFVEKTNIFKTSPPFKLDYIKSCYPGYNFSEIIH